MNLPAKSIKGASWHRSNTNTTLFLKHKNRKIAWVKKNKKELFLWQVILNPKFVPGKGNRISGKSTSLSKAFMVVETILLSVGYEPLVNDNPLLNTPDPTTARFSLLEID